jgi:hypothetical protein
MSAMSATVFPLPPNEAQTTAEAAVDSTVDFLRRLAGMMSGGRNAEMLLVAAGTIEELSRRAAQADQLCLTQQHELSRTNALRETTALAVDNLSAEIEALMAQLASNAEQAEHDRLRFADEALRLQDLASEAQVQLSALMSERAALQASAVITERTLLAAQMQSLLLARTQFNTLADGFARNGDVISRTIAEIGGCTIDKALKDSTAETWARHPALSELFKLS